MARFRHRNSEICMFFFSFSASSALDKRYTFHNGFYFLTNIPNIYYIMGVCVYFIRGVKWGVCSRVRGGGGAGGGVESRVRK